MWLLATEIPDGLLWGLAPVMFSLVLAWAAWVTIATASVKTMERAIEDHEQRLRALEARP